MPDIVNHQDSLESVVRCRTVWPRLGLTTVLYYLFMLIGLPAVLFQ